ncbi:MAG: hypothetical protein WBL88_14960 [Nitrososphaeraceae archaeon]
MEGDDSKNTLAIRLIPDHVNWMVDLAVYSFYLTYMVTMIRLFELLEEQAENLKRYWDSSKPDESIDKWFRAADENAKPKLPVISNKYCTDYIL